jgi:hypothetical protein
MMARVGMPVRACNQVMPFVEQARVAAELVQDKAFDARLLLRLEA